MTGEINLTDWIREAYQLDSYDERTAFLMDKHGGSTNKHCVFQERETVELARIGRSHAEARLAQNAHGMWLTGIDADYAIGGRGDPVSVWNRTAYDSRDNALDACRAQCARYFQSIADDYGSCVTDHMKAEARRMVEALSPKEPPPQLSLFDLLAPAPAKNATELAR